MQSNYLPGMLNLNVSCEMGKGNSLCVCVCTCVSNRKGKIIQTSVIKMKC